jgi:hypothetical protein
LIQLSVAQCVNEAAPARLTHDSFFARSVGLWGSWPNALSHAGELFGDEMYRKTHSIFGKT